MTRPSQPACAGLNEMLMTPVLDDATLLKAAEDFLTRGFEEDSAYLKKMA